NPCKNPTATFETNITTNRATLHWTPAAATQGSEIVLDNSPNDPLLSGTVTNVDSFEAINLTPNTLYYYHVRNLCMNPYTSDWVTDSFMTLPCTLTPPSIMNSGNSTFCEGSITTLSVPTVPFASYTWYDGTTPIIGASSSMFVPF